MLAACPLAKKHGITTAERLGEALGKCPELVVVRPRMQEYIHVSLQITTIFKQFTDLVEPYSIDEQFLDCTGSQNLFGDPQTMAKQIKTEIMLQTGVNVRSGISENKIISKMACDNYAKKNESGIYSLPREELSSTLWTLPVSKMFMVGSRMTKHFARMGIYTIGELAGTPLHDLKHKMRIHLGKNSDIQAELYWRIANGIDDSPVTPDTHDKQKIIGHQMTLPNDYQAMNDILAVLLELTEMVCQRCRAKGYMGSVVSVGCMGADYERPTGFSRQMKISDPTNITDEVYAVVKKLFHQHWDGLAVRKVGVSLCDFILDKEYQLTLFGNQERKRALEKTTDELKLKYGDASIFRAVSLTDAGQARDRSKKIGGHYK